MRCLQTVKPICYPALITMFRPKISVIFQNGEDMCIRNPLDDYLVEGIFYTNYNAFIGCKIPHNQNN